MNQRRRTAGFLLLAGIILVLFVALVLNTPNRALPAAQQLPDGTVVTIRKVSFGKILKCPIGNFWKRAAVQLLPARISDALGFPIIYSNPVPTTFIVVENFRTNGTFSSAPAMPFNFATTIEMTDDVGNRFHLNEVNQLFISSNDVVELFTVPLVSHLATNLHLNLGHSSWKPLFTNYAASFDVRNPAARLKSLWHPGPFPLTNQLDNLTVIFSSMSADTPQIQILERGAPSTNWSSGNYDVVDDEGGGLQSGIDFHLSPLEPRRFTFTLHHPLPPEPSDILTFSNMALDGRYRAAAPIRGNLHSHIILISQFDRGTLVYSANPGITDGKTTLTIAYADEDGSRQTPVKDNPVGLFGGSVGYGPPIPDSVRSADITFTFAPFTNRFVEFIAFPEAARTNFPATVK